MIETESNEYLQSFQQHIGLARARLSAAVLPLLEHSQGVPVLGRQCDIASVLLLVSARALNYESFIINPVVFPSFSVCLNSGRWV